MYVITANMPIKVKELMEKARAGRPSAGGGVGGGVGGEKETGELSESWPWPLAVASTLAAAQTPDTKPNVRSDSNFGRQIIDI